MVFQAISEAGTLHTKSMATAPVKSQPLHNFSLSFLKWGKNQANNHRCRRHSDTARESPSHDHRSSPSEPESDGGGAVCKNDSESENRKCAMGSRSARNRVSLASCSSSVVEKSERSLTVMDGEDAGGEEVKAKILIRFRTTCKEESSFKNNSAIDGDGRGGGGGGGGGRNSGEVEESVHKPWNLRPRRAFSKNPVEITGFSKNGESPENLTTPSVENLPKSHRLRGFAEAQNAEKKEKRKFSVSLTREEIEEDIFALTGSKPARRPKKRPKNIQKQLDNNFPGLWLSEITEDIYKVPDAPPKR